MYKVSLRNLHDIYLKGYADALSKRANLENGLEVYDWLANSDRVPTSVRRSRDCRQPAIMANRNHQQRD